MTATDRRTRIYVLECRVCAKPSGAGRYFCASCGILNTADAKPADAAYAASPRSRLAAFLLDYLIIWLTAGVGWLLWLAIVARRGQSPGKALLGLRVTDRTGRAASARLVWLREFGWDAAVGTLLLVVLLLLGAVAHSLGDLLELWFWLTVLFWLVSFGDAARLLRDADRQSWHDRALGTLVVGGR